MKTPSLVPSMDWSKSDANEFREAAGLGTISQQYLCAVCVKESNYTPPTSIVFVNGSSLCSQHA